MSLRPLKTISRRGDWRARLPLWDRETFQDYRVTPTGQAGDAIVSFAVYPAGHGYDHCGWLRDYGRWSWRGRHCHRRPILNVFTDDGTGYLRLADDGISVLLSVPQPIVTALHHDQYMASIAAAYGDGSVIDLGIDLVNFTGPTDATVWHGVRMAGGLQGAGDHGAINDFAPYSVPILPGAAGAWVAAAVAQNRFDPSADFPAYVAPPPVPPYAGPMTAGGYQPAGTDAPVNSLVTDQTPVSASDPV